MMATALSVSGMCWHPVALPPSSLPRFSREYSTTEPLVRDHGMNGVAQRITLGSLALLALSATVGSVVLAAIHAEIPGSVIAVGAASVGALAAYLLPSNLQRSDNGGGIRSKT
jgi:hypothetical protein